MPKKRALIVASAILLVIAIIVAVLLINSGDGDDNPDDKATPARTTVPAPDGGTINQTVKPGSPGKTYDAKIDAPVILSDSVMIDVSSIRFATVKPGGPGESGGSAVIAKIRIGNESKAPISLDNVIVTLSYGKNNTVGQPLTSEPYKPFTGSLAPGDAAVATYVFRVPGNQRASAVISVQHGAQTDVARFGRTKR